MNSLKSAVILLIEDDTGDQKLIKQSFNNSKIANEMRFCSGAEEALEYLQKSKKGDVECPMPDLILLDLNMPGMGGKEFLGLLKEDDKLDTIPVVILTTSDSDRDVLDSFKLQASGYVKKPVSLEDFCQVIKDLSDYWFVICKRVDHNRDPKHASDTCVISR
jgi:CheY-like chemotaxis protein